MIFVKVFEVKYGLLSIVMRNQNIVGLQSWVHGRWQQNTVALVAQVLPEEAVLSHLCPSKSYNKKSGTMDWTGKCV